MLLRVERSDGLALAFDNDDTGRRTGITPIGLGGASLRLTEYGYDIGGRMDRADCAFGMSVDYAWQPDRPLLARWHNRTRRSQTAFSYDDAGRVVHTETTGLWNGDRFLYDAQARRTTYLPGGDAARAQVSAYNENDNVTAETDALGATTRHSFDRYGFRIATTDATGATVRTRYDIFGNVRSTSTPRGGRRCTAGDGRASSTSSSTARATSNATTTTPRPTSRPRSTPRATARSTSGTPTAGSP
ncbi:hypothetical protein ACLBYG_28345 [Methylobacterium sp. D53M]